MPVSLRTSILCQHQEMLSDRYSMCGLLSISNALQTRDFITPAMLRPILARLVEVSPSVDHGHPRYGAYTMDALQKGLQKRRKQLIYLNTKSGFKSRPKRPASIVRSRKSALLIIGRRPGQRAGTWHCIARAWVGNKFVFIDSDTYHFFPNREELLTSFFETVDGVYSIEDIPRANL